MNYTKYNIGPYNLHIINTDKFKTVTIDIEMRRKIVKEEITIRNFLSNILIQSTKKYPTNRLLTLETEKLYNTNIASSNARVGNYMITGFSMRVLNDKYTEPGLLNKALDLLSNILFKPNINNNEFDLISFNNTKRSLEKDIMSIKENMAKYGLIKLLEEMGGNSPIAYSGYGYISDLEKINSEALINHYQEMLKKDIIDIFVVGEVNSSEIKRMIIDKFKFNTIKRSKDDIFIKHEPVRFRLKERTLIENVTQAKLSIGCKLKNLSDYELNYVLKIYNQILGGSSNSKLFVNVREKESLAYYVSSMLKPYDGLLLIYSGINYENYQKTLKLIKKQMEQIKKGKITDDDLANAKTSIISSINSIYDNPSGIITDYYAMELSKTDDKKTKIKKISDVKKAEVIALAKKINIDTVYLIHGGETNEKVNL